MPKASCKIKIVICPEALELKRKPKSGQEAICLSIDKRIKLTGEVKGDYLRDAILNAEIHDNVGKFMSNRIALETRNIMREL